MPYWPANPRRSASDGAVMRAMILAAGRGERMRPLTDHTPKPLLEVGGRTLIEHHLIRLAQAGVREVVINLAHLGERIAQALGDGARQGVRIVYSHEGERALETGGGIFHALPMMGEAPFIVVNGDVYSDFPYASLPTDVPGWAHLVMVPNPAQHPQGDFLLAGDSVRDEGEPRLTYSGIGVLRRELFADCRAGVFPLAPLLRRAMTAGRVSGQRYDGLWCDVGTPERLRALDEVLSQR